MLEADGFGFLEQQTGGNPTPTRPSRRRALPELAGLPNTVAGWGMAFLQLRKSVGASNAILGMHISGWATRQGHRYFNVTDALSPEVDKVYAFLSPLGLAANPTGQTWDLLVGDPLDRDSDYYTARPGQNRWWDAATPRRSSRRSFNRYAEWLRLWNVKAAKRWVLWQIPLGNSNHLQRLQRRQSRARATRTTARSTSSAPIGSAPGQVRQGWRHWALLRCRRVGHEHLHERRLHRWPAFHEEPRGRFPQRRRTRDSIVRSRFDSALAIRQRARLAAAGRSRPQPHLLVHQIDRGTQSRRNHRRP